MSTPLRVTADDVLLRLGVTHGEIAALCRRWRIVSLSVFGSFARNEATANSDVDLLVAFEPAAQIGWEISDIAAAFAEVFKRPVDLATVASLKPRLRPQILNEMVIIYESERS